MSEKTIFGDNGMGYSNNHGDELTGAYTSVRNKYVQANNSDDADEQWVGFLKNICYDADRSLGEVQNEADTPKVSNFEEGSSDFPTEVEDGEVVPKGIPTNPENKKEAAEKLQMMLGFSLGSEKSEEVPLTGNDSPDNTEDDNENESNDSPDTDMESEFDELVENVSGMGEETVKNFRRFVAANDWEVPAEIDMEVTVTDKYDSLDEVPAAEVAEMSAEQIEALQG